MKISIITVCYNSCKTIEKTFRSIASQNYYNIEYIVVDGGSKDGTLKLIEKYENYIHKWISEPDKGLYDAMNKGIAMATGDYIGILNADDVFNDNYVISKIANFFTFNQVDANIANIVQINNSDKIVRHYSSKKWRPSKLAIGFMPPHPSIFMKKDLFEKYGQYRLDFKIGADYELLTRMFLCNQISWKYLDIVTHRMLIGGVSSSGWKSYIAITKEINKSLLLNNIQFSYWKVKYRLFWKIKEFIFN